ncbi:MAG: hypothetical protein S0880_17425 [Actinomycetota bacterium]|nr:hypothetical protein [Actinomycetota bacterium]
MLTFTDQVGVFDRLTVVIDAGALAILVRRRRHLATAGGPGR